MGPGSSLLVVLPFIQTSRTQRRVLEYQFALLNKLTPPMLEKDQPSSSLLP